MVVVYLCVLSDKQLNDQQKGSMSPILLGTESMDMSMDMINFDNFGNAEIWYHSMQIQWQHKIILEFHDFYMIFPKIFYFP